jgi:HK97 family phage major capsid protein
MNLPVENTVSIPFAVNDILSQISLIDIGDKDDIGEVVAVMKRKTYYSSILPISDNSFDYPNINGIRVKFSSAVADDEIILGDFSEYVLGDRQHLRLESATHTLFTDEITLFRLVARYDGKPHINGAFVRLSRSV